MVLDKVISGFPFNYIGFCSLIPERDIGREKKWSNNIHLVNK